MLFQFDVFLIDFLQIQVKLKVVGVDFEQKMPVCNPNLKMHEVHHKKPAEHTNVMNDRR